MATMLLLLGVVSGAQVLSYPIISETSPRDIESSCLGLVAVIVNAIGGGSQMLFGWLISQNVGGIRDVNTSVHILSQYRLALMLIPLASGLSILAAVAIHWRRRAPVQM